MIADGTDIGRLDSVKTAEMLALSLPSGCRGVLGVDPGLDGGDLKLTIDPYMTHCVA